MKRPPTLVARIRTRLGRVPRAFSMFFATSLVARAIGITCQILQVPLVVNALGSEAFGLWATMTSVTNFVLFADLGLGIGAQNRLAEHLACHETEEARELFGSVFLLLAVVGLSLAFAFTWLVGRLNFASLFHLHAASTIAQAPSAGLAMGWIFCAGFPFGLAQRLAFARQEGWMYNVAQAAGSVMSLSMVALGVHARWSFAGLVAGAQGAILAGNVLLLAVQLVDLHWFATWRLGVRFALCRDLLQVGAFFSIQQVLGTVLFSLPQVVISTQLGAAAVTPFNLVQRLYNLFAVVQNAFMLPLWPAYSKAKAQRQFAWMRSALRNSVVATAVCCVLPMIASACFAPQVIRLWIGDGEVQPALSIIWLLCVWNALSYFQQPYSYLLAGVSEIRRTTLYSVLSALCSAALMFALAGPLGVPGVVLGLILGYLPFNFVGNLVEARRYLRATGDIPVSVPAPNPAT